MDKAGAFDISQWLGSIGLGHFSPQFAAQSITELEILMEVTESHLKELGLTIGNRIKFFAEVKKLRPPSDSVLLVGADSENNNNQALWFKVKEEIISLLNAENTQSAGNSSFFVSPFGNSSPFSQRFIERPQGAISINRRSTSTLTKAMKYLNKLIAKLELQPQNSNFHFGYSTHRHRFWIKRKSNNQEEEELYGCLVERASIKAVYFLFGLLGDSIDSFLEHVKTHGQPTWVGELSPEASIVHEDFSGMDGPPQEIMYYNVPVVAAAGSPDAPEEAVAPNTSGSG